MQNGDASGASMLCVLGELVVDMLPVPWAGAGPEGTAPRFVARPGGAALNVAVAAGRLGTPDVHGEDGLDAAAINCTRVGADPPTRAELVAARAAR